MTARTDAANHVNAILSHLGGLSALVPAGPVRDQVDDQIERMAELAKTIGALPRDQWKDSHDLPEGG